MPPRDKAGKPILKRGTKSQGLLDKEGNDWVWDRQGAMSGNPHWDVQHPDGSHSNANLESSDNPGEVNHGNENFPTRGRIPPI